MCCAVLRAMTFCEDVVAYRRTMARLGKCALLLLNGHSMRHIRLYIWGLRRVYMLCTLLYTLCWRAERRVVMCVLNETAIRYARRRRRCEMHTRLPYRYATHTEKTHSSARKHKGKHCAPCCFVCARDGKTFSDDKICLWRQKQVQKYLSKNICYSQSAREFPPPAHINKFWWERWQSFLCTLRAKSLSEYFVHARLPML